MANQPSPVKKIGEVLTAPGGSCVTVGHFLPLKNHGYLAAVGSDTSAPLMTLSGGGLTWVQVGTMGAAGGNYALTVFRALKTSSAGLVDEPLTIGFGGQAQTNVTITVIDFNFVDTSGTDGSGFVVQTNTDNGPSGTSFSPVALAAFGDATNNAFYAVGLHASVEDTVPENTFTELDDLQSGFTMQTAYRIGEDVLTLRQYVGSWATSSNNICIQVEVKMRGATSMLLELGRALESDSASSVIVSQVGSSTGSTLAETTRGGLVQRVGEALGLAYDVDGYEQRFLRRNFDKAIEEVLLHTHCYIAIGDMALTSGVAEYRQPTSILAIDDGRGSTPAGIGHYELVTLEEMIARQSANPVSDSWHKFIALAGHNLLIVSPTPSTSETLRYFYVPRPSPTTADTNDFTSATYGGLPTYASEAVEYFMLWKASEYDDKYAPLKPTDYKLLFEAELGEIRYKMRRQRGRTNPMPRVGYPSRRQPFAPKNSQYPR